MEQLTKMPVTTNAIKEQFLFSKIKKYNKNKEEIFLLELHKQLQSWE